MRNSKKLSQERFGRYAESYVDSPVHAKGPDLARLVELVGHHPTWEALDVATGGGHTALVIAPHVGHLIATDITEPMLTAARDFVLSRGVTNVDFQPADAEHLPFAEETFDLVTCRVAAHHFPDPTRFVAEAARVLKPQGLFLLQDQTTPEDSDAARWITDFERRRDPSHVRALSHDEWLKLLGASGLSVESADRFEKRIGLLWWVGAQQGSAHDLADLRELLHRAPPAVRAWMRPADIDTEEAAFSIVHWVFSARKSWEWPVCC